MNISPLLRGDVFCFRIIFATFFVNTKKGITFAEHF